MPYRRFIRFSFVCLCLLTIFTLIAILIQTPWEKKYPDELNVFTWADYIPQEIANEFEKQTGIHVHFHYYSSNEELLVKMRSTKGTGYDLLIPSDYAVKILIDEHLIKPIDKTKIDNFHQIAPFLCNRHFDPNNNYSVPSLWEVFGLGVDREALASNKEILEKPSFKHLFQPTSYKITMTPDVVEAVAIASQYLYNKTEALSKEQLLEVEQLLTKQKKWTEAYADYRAKYLISTKNCSIALLRSPFFHQIKADSPFIDFLIPEGPIFLSIESYAISQDTQQEEAAYKFINFLMKKENTLKMIEFCPLYPSVIEYGKDLKNYPEFDETLHKIIERDEFECFRYLVSENDMRKLWINVKKS
ncbi:MAG: extracellular solute-binding protein [Chlamydiae bacterium]|nr:extracellular solute-binding protein [Chlamydiota bacterium]